jgi:glycosyltransferase involved in cell wall biosynthesis
MQAEVAKVDLICPVREPPQALADIGEEIDRRICIHTYERLHENALNAIVSAADVIQIPGNSGWNASSAARRLLKAARRADKIVILGVSSNRARTARLNASGKGFLRVIKGYVQYLDVRFSQSFLALRSDGVFVVGRGVARLFTYLNRNMHVGVASWIKESDIESPTRDAPPRPLRVCMASRLERMKGLHVGISAVQNLIGQHRMDLRLTVIGEGPEKVNLHQQVVAAGLSGITNFLAPVAYKPFLKLLGSMDIVLLTNLNNEQPRLIFDAVSRGCLPICPDIPSYHGLGLDRRLLYQQGNARDLARAIDELSDGSDREALRSKILDIARTFTIDAMHMKRAAWIMSLFTAQNSSRSTL